MIIFTSRKVLDDKLKTLSDDFALQVVMMFDEWHTDTAYTMGERVRYNDKLYRCEQSHTSQPDWTPNLTPAMWTEVAEPGTIPVWKQPTGAQDAYREGERVKYPDESGDIWVSVIDYNTYVPGVYGWKKE